MEINTKIKFVSGSFNTESEQLVCVKNKKYGSVDLCFKTNSLHVPFAQIKLHSEDRAIDADAVFEDACKLGDEIARRWNQVPDAISNLLKMKIIESDLPDLILNCFRRKNPCTTETFADILAYKSDREFLQSMKGSNFGNKALSEVRKYMELKGIFYGMDITKYGLTPKK
jgi:hypothetical protein